MHPISHRNRAIYLMILLLIVLAAGGLFSSGLLRQPAPAASSAQPASTTLTLLLVPLDSRPPCTQYVEQLAGLAGIRVILPPPELLDQYQSPGSKDALRSWLRTAAPSADAAILSTDMLIHGGLLASRQSRGTMGDAEEVFALLQQLRAEHPRLKLYAFSIIPRLLLADSSENAKYQKNALKYSVLKDQIYTFENPADVDRLQSLSKQIPAEVINRYQSLYAQSTQINKRLIDLAAAGTLDALVLGQDDGQPFGLPNVAKQQLEQYCHARPGLEQKVYITRGTDEVALTLLGPVTARAAGFAPKFYVRYSDPAVPHIIMPYMPHPIAKTVDEKILLAQGVQVQNPQEADIILYVHAGTAQTRPAQLTAAAEEVKKLLQDGYRVALVDLTENFDPAQTLLPSLLKVDAPLSRLTAYAGWNTTSNSTGTAVTQALIHSAVRHSEFFASAQPGLNRRNLEFVVTRFLDDWYYQKDVFPRIQDRLITAGVDTMNLGKRREDTSRLIQDWLRSRAADLLSRNLSQHLLPPDRPGDAPARISGIHLNSQLPWPRILEVRLGVALDITESSR